MRSQRKSSVIISNPMQPAPHMSTPSPYDSWFITCPERVRARVCERWRGAGGREEEFVCVRQGMGEGNTEKEEEEESRGQVGPRGQGSTGTEKEEEEEGRRGRRRRVPLGRGSTGCRRVRYAFLMKQQAVSVTSGSAHKPSTSKPRDPDAQGKELENYIRKSSMKETYDMTKKSMKELENKSDFHCALRKSWRMGAAEE